MQRRVNNKSKLSAYTNRYDDDFDRSLTNWYERYERCIYWEDLDAQIHIRRMKNLWILGEAKRISGLNFEVSLRLDYERYNDLNVESIIVNVWCECAASIHTSNIKVTYTVDK